MPGEAVAAQVDAPPPAAPISSSELRALARRADRAFGGFVLARTPEAQQEHDSSWADFLNGLANARPLKEQQFAAQLRLGIAGRSLGGGALTAWHLGGFMRVTDQAQQRVMELGEMLENPALDAKDRLELTKAFSSAAVAASKCFQQLHNVLRDQGITTSRTEEAARPQVARRRSFIPRQAVPVQEVTVNPGASATEPPPAQPV